MGLLKTATTCFVIGGAIGFLVNQSLSPLANIDVSGQLDVALQKDKAMVDLYKQISIEKAKVASLISDVYELHSRPHVTSSAQLNLENKDSLELINLLQSMQAHASEDDEYLVDLIQQKLDALLRNNTVSLSEALNELAHYAGTPTGDLLVDVLSAINDPRIENSALLLVNASNIEEQRIAGFDLLSKIQSKSPVVRGAIVHILRTEQEPEIINAALSALKPSVVNDYQHLEIIEILTTLTYSHDEKIRAQSVTVLAEWAISEDHLEVVVNKTQDMSVQVRAQAAFALGNAKLKTEMSKLSLIALISDDKEDLRVRQNAWGSLGAYPLAESDVLRYRKIKVELENNEQYLDGITNL